MAATQEEQESWLKKLALRHSLIPASVLLLGIVLLLLFFSVIRIEYLKAEQATQASAIVLALAELSNNIVSLYDADRLDENGLPALLDQIFDASAELLYGTSSLECIQIAIPALSIQHYWPTNQCMEADPGTTNPIRVRRELDGGLVLLVEARLDDDAPIEIWAGEFAVVGGLILVTALSTLLALSISVRHAINRQLRQLFKDMGEFIAIDDLGTDNQGESGMGFVTGNLEQLTRKHAAILERLTELRRREALEEILRSKSLHGLVLADKDQGIIEFNPAAEKIFRLRREDALGRRVGDVLVPPHHRAAHERAWTRFNETGNRTVLDLGVFEIDARTTDDQHLDLEMRVETIESEGDPHFVAYINDITERKAREVELRDARDEAESATEAKSQFLAMMSHEMRTPLNGVLGLIGLTLDEELQSRERDYLQKAEASGRHLLHLLNDLLDLTQIEADALQFESVITDTKKLLDEVLSLVMVTASNKNVRIATSVDKSVPSHVYADDGRLRQVLLNLANNAVKFSAADGQVDVSCSLQDRRGQDNAVLLFEVADKGPGIQPKDQDSLFEPFTQLDMSPSRRYEGSGLGLAISKRLVEAMEGQIGVDSRPGHGSKFWFTLPLQVADVAPEKTSNEFDSSDSMRRPRHGRILVVEDSPSNALVVSSILSKQGYTVDMAANGIEAIQAVQALPYDLVFMDISMPDMDGFEVTRKIRMLNEQDCASRGGSQRLPIVALTANAMREDRQKCLDAGMDDFCAKPVSKSALLEIAQRWIQAQMAEHRS